jgi:sporulation protein YlmC with PRC-barrel domain
MKKITELQHLEIYSKSGAYMGRVFDLRSSGLPEHGITSSAREIDEIVYGTVGLFERLGLRQSKAETVDWSSVLEIDEKRIVVDI